MELREKLPEKILSWQLKGAGLECLGTNGRPDLVAFPPYNEDDLIVRVDACGLCFSDIKLISAGKSHPRIEGRDLARNPTVPGHEVAMTVVGVGDNLKGEFSLGSRFIIQADIYYKGKGTAFGYAIPGGLSQYVVIGKEVLEGDEGCYLLPVRQETSYVEAALVEPWTCVIASYQIKARTDLRTDAVMYFFGSARGQIPLDLRDLDTRRISRLYHEGLSSENEERVRRLAESAGALLEAGAPASGGPAPTDIVCAGTPDRDSFARLVNAADADSVLAVHSSDPVATLPVDVGKVHYRRLELVGSTDGSVLSSYGNNPREAVVPGGTAWFVGGAGPMGQMHVIKAVCDRNGPGRILVTDLSDERLETLQHLVSLIAARCGRKVSISFKNPKDLDGDELDSFLSKEYPSRFDDIVVLVPVTAIISQVSNYLAPRGVLNIFAGVKVGTIADLPLDAIVRGRARVTGSSGSPLAAMRDTLSMVESGSLSTALSLAAIGDMYAASRGMKALIDNTFTGKVIIFPFARGIGLKSLKELARDLPETAPLLLDGQYWSAEAEAAFLKSRYFAS